MTREEAKQIISDIDKAYRNYTADEYKALEMAIQALSQEPCDDAISREELLKAIDTWDKFGCDANTKLVPYKDHYIPYIHYDDVIKCIKGMPPVTQKSGKWIYDDEYSDWFDVTYKCSCCKRSIIIPYGARNKVYKDYPYCHCGAKMESEEV